MADPKDAPRDATASPTPPDLPARTASPDKEKDVKGGRQGPGTQTEDEVYIG